MANPNKITDIYELKEEIGRGEFSYVVRAVHKESGETFAIKVINRDNIDSSRLENEIRIMTTVKHPSIISMREYFETDKNVYLVMELVTGGELFDRITELGCYSEKTACLLVGNIVSAIKYLHDNEIVHRDLKPTNLLLKAKDSDTEVKIADFGLSKILGEGTLMQTACGTPIYVAPEVLIGEPYDKAVDMWSVGVITYILLCGFPPFFDDGQNMGELFEQIINGEFDFPEEYWTDVSEEAKDFIENLLIVDPVERMTAEEALAHPWFRVQLSDKELKVIGNMKKFVKK